MCNAEVSKTVYTLVQEPIICLNENVDRIILNLIVEKRANIECTEFSLLTAFKMKFSWLIRIM